MSHWVQHLWIREWWKMDTSLEISGYVDIWCGCWFSLEISVITIVLYWFHTVKKYVNIQYKGTAKRMITDVNFQKKKLYLGHLWSNCFKGFLIIFYYILLFIDWKYVNINKTDNKHEAKHFYLLFLMHISSIYIHI